MNLNPRVGRWIIDALIVLFWVFILWDSFLQGREMPHLLGNVDLPELPVGLFVTVALVGSASVSLFTFWQRKKIMDEMPVVTERVDRIFGAGSYSRFTHRLRPVWASILSSSILGSVGLYTTYTVSQHVWSYAICGGMLVFALSMFIAWLVSRRFPPVLS